MHKLELLVKKKKKKKKYFICARNFQARIFNEQAKV